MVAEEHESNFELTKDSQPIPMGELRGVCCKDFGEFGSGYNGTALYIGPYYNGDLTVLKILYMLLDCIETIIYFTWRQINHWKYPGQ